MKTKLLLIVISFFVALATMSQTIIEEEQDYPSIIEPPLYEPDSTPSDKTTFSAEYGNNVSVSGQIRVLLVFAELDCSTPCTIQCDPSTSYNPQCLGQCSGTGTCIEKKRSCLQDNPTLWAPGQLPYAKDTWFDQTYTSGVAPTNYLTNYYYQMSMGNYIVLGDYYPQIVTIPCSTITSQSDAGDKVIDALNATSSTTITTAHGYTLSDFDYWGNEGAGIQKTNSANNKVDVVVIVWRNLGDFGCGYCGFGVQNFFNTTLKGKNIKIGASFNGADGGQGAQDFFIAEYFHAMFGGNNWHTGGGADKHTFIGTPASYSITSQSGSASNVVCGWDRLHLGWKNPSKTYITSAIDATTQNEVNTENFDITTFPNGGTYILRDFVSSGDAIRIKLPHINWMASNDIKNQYLWLENHQIVTAFDKFYTQSCADDNNGQMPFGSKGMYAYIQVGKDIKTSGSSSDIYPSTWGVKNY